MITLNQHRIGISQEAVARFSDSTMPKEGLSAFFPSKTAKTKLVSIEVQRNRRSMAVDVERWTGANRNIISRSTEKIFAPPAYAESLDFTSCQSYDVTFGQGMMPTAVTGGALISSVVSELFLIKNKIIRAIELQRAQVLQTGVVVLKNQTNVNYNRKAESLVALPTGASQWSNPTTCSPIEDLKKGAEFLRTVGLSGGNVINAILGQGALSNFLKSDEIKETADFRRIDRISLNMPQFDNVSGMVFHGQLAAGDYIVNIWTYNESYEDPKTGKDVKYIETNNVILLPDDFEGCTIHAAVDAVLGDPISGQYVAPQEADYLVYDVIDQIKKSWEFIVESAPLVIPVSVDRIYTLKTA
jgi:hypothetical protein